MKVYLAGPIQGRSDAECVHWRLEAAARLRALEHEPLDPLRRDYRGRELEPGIAQQIVERDKRDIDAADAVLVWWDGGPSVGTSMEILYAWQHGLRVIVIDASSRPLSPWLLYHCRGRVVHTLEEGIAAVCAAPGARA